MHAVESDLDVVQDFRVFRRIESRRCGPCEAHGDNFSRGGEAAQEPGNVACQCSIAAGNDHEPDWTHPDEKPGVKQDHVVTVGEKLLPLKV